MLPARPGRQASVAADATGPLSVLADGLWAWSARHPQWHPGDFGAEVGCFAARAGSDTILIDPLLPGVQSTPSGALGELIAGRVTVLITIPYHVRSAERIWRSHGEAVEILGHEAVAKRLPPDAPFRPVSPGDRLPHGVGAHAIGNPRRQEMPVHLPGHRALAFGDAVVGVGGGLRVWMQSPITEKSLDWYRRRLVPSLEPLLELDFDRVLVTHGAPVLRDGRAALREALDAPPWYHRG